MKKHQLSQTVAFAMDSRKVSSLSMLSDVSDVSFTTGKSSNLVIENIGDIPINDAAVSLASLRSTGGFISLLSGDSKVFLAELKLRADSECVAARSALLELPGVKEDKKYLDVTILQCGPGEVRLGLLGERKNKERFVSVVEVLTGGRAVTLGREVCQYDKTSMLGKSLTHISSSAWSGHQGEADIFTCGNIIRKLKLEGELLKPTSGRVQVPPECVDGTLCLCVVSVPNKNSYTIVSSFRTKSAGKNKYQINWFSGRNDEISAPAGKSSLKLSEDQEPSVILSDPRDSRAVYVICNNNSDNSSGLYKLVRGRRLEEAITTFPFPVTEASMVVGGDKSLFLLVLDASSCGLKVFQVMKTQGYRGSQASWSRCPELQSVLPGYHAVSCSQCKWQLSPAITDLVLSPRCHYQLGLATLLSSCGDIVLEPEAATQYRIRAMGGDNINDVILIVLDDIERAFESEEESLSSMTLKICMNSAPSKEGLTALRHWTNTNRIFSAEIHTTHLHKELHSLGNSESIIFQAISPELFR